MFWKHNKQSIPKIPYNPESQTAVLKCSICNGEQVAGFQDIKTGKFHEVMLIKNDTDLQMFQQTYKIKEIKKIY